MSVFFWSRILVAFIFILWLIPMGIFIAPAKEKLLCDGQRAICMCSKTSSVKSKIDAESGIVVKAVPSAQKESSSSVGNYFLAAVFENTNPLLSSVSPFIHENFYNLAVDRSIDPVPKS